MYLLLMGGCKATNTLLWRFIIMGVEKNNTDFMIDIKDVAYLSSIFSYLHHQWLSMFQILALFNMMKAFEWDTKLLKNIKARNDPIIDDFIKTNLKYI